MKDSKGIPISSSTAEIGAAYIDAVSRVYAAGLRASGSTLEGHRRDDARGDVKDFLQMLDELKR